MMDGHKYGGAWTDLKLDILRKYLSFFTTALRKKRFELLYIDAFAGSGGRMIERIIAQEGPLFGTQLSLEQVDVPGSARIALQTSPPFDRVILIERHGKRYAALETLCAQFPEIRARPKRGEANAAIVEICRETSWRGRDLSEAGTRAVLFLDPYGMNVAFSTLKEIAATEAIDVWYLFPLSGLYRQAARSGRKLTPEKRASITRILGTSDWETEFYRADAGNDLVGDLFEPRRIVDVRAIESYVKARLETVFPSVSEPFRLSMKNGSPLFSLFFAVSNPDPKAIGLARKVANHILKAGISSQVRPRN